MKIKDIIGSLQTYLASTRIVLRSSSMTARTTVTSETIKQVKAIVSRIYGEGNILNINQVMSEKEEVTETTKTLNAEWRTENRKHRCSLVYHLAPFA